MTAEHFGIRVEGLSKGYRLGVTGHETLAEEFRHWWHKSAGRRPLSPVGKSSERHSSRLTTQMYPDRPGWFWALRDVSFVVQPGEVLGIIGANGAGKSTLLKILARITAPTRGRAQMAGRISSLLEVGTGFHPELTGRENVFINGAILGMTEQEIRRKFDDIVDFADMSDFIGTPVKRYSSGMRTRLAFAVAAHLEPDILLVDEVLAVGDAEFQTKCMGKMEQMAGSGRTVLFVSHRLSSVTQMCERALWIDHGRIRKEGASEEVIEAYLSAVTTHGGEIRWKDGLTHPRVEGLSIHVMRLLNEHGNVAGAWLDQAPFSFEVEYELARAAPGFRLGFEIAPHHGAPWCVCFQPPTDSALHQPGRHRVRAHIPGGRILAGRRQITTLAEQPGSGRAVCVGSPLTFDIEASGTTPLHRGLVNIEARWTRMPANESDAGPTEDTR